MNKIVFMFPGQGSQYTGMGKDFFWGSQEIQSFYAEAKSVLNMDLAEKIFSSDTEALKNTSVSQPAILITSICCYRMLKEAGVTPGVMIGHSLGEFSALTCSGALSFIDALKIVQERSQRMAEASRNHPGKMAAVIGLPVEKIEEICLETKARGIISIANFNSPQQTVIAGEDAAVEEAVNLAREKGAKRVVVLRVSGPFHTELMREVVDKFKTALESVEIKSPQIPVVSTVTAEPVENPVLIRENLINQVIKPVRWTDTISYLIDRGFDTFIEVGPRKVLSMLLSQFDKKVLSLNVEDRKSLQKTKAALA